MDTGYSNLCLKFSYWTFNFNCFYKSVIIGNLFLTWERSKSTYKVLHNILHSLSTKTLHSNLKKHFFLDLAKSGRSRKYLAGTDPSRICKRVAGSTGARTRPEIRFRFGTVPVPVEFGLVPVPVRYRQIWRYQTGTATFVTGTRFQWRFRYRYRCEI